MSTTCVRLINAKGVGGWLVRGWPILMEFELERRDDNLQMKRKHRKGWCVIDLLNRAKDPAIVIDCLNMSKFIQKTH